MTTSSPLPSSRRPVPRDPSTLSPAEIEEQIEVTRTRLAGTLDQIADRVAPKNIANRQKEKVRVKVDAARTSAVAGAEQVKAQFVDAQGKPRPERLAALGAAVALVLALTVWRKRH